ncbi:MAG: hypothetical protein QXQ57_01530 [Sulfolobales archaeon]
MRKVKEVRWREGVEDWERPIIAAAIYFADPRPEEEVMGIMTDLVGKDEAEAIASLVWRIAFGEGYTLDQWADLLESLKTLSPWEAIWRFQELAEKGLRRKHEAPPPKTISDREALRAACKYLGLG